MLKVQKIKILCFQIPGFFQDGFSFCLTCRKRRPKSCFLLEEEQVHLHFCLIDILFWRPENFRIRFWVWRCDFQKFNERIEAKNQFSTVQICSKLYHLTFKKIKISFFQELLVSIEASWISVHMFAVICDKKREYSSTFHSRN